MKVASSNHSTGTELEPGMYHPVILQSSRKVLKYNLLNFPVE